MKVLLLGVAMDFLLGFCLGAIAGPFVWELVKRIFNNMFNK